MLQYRPRAKGLDTIERDFFLSCSSCHPCMVSLASNSFFGFFIDEYKISSEANAIETRNADVSTLGSH